MIIGGVMLDEHKYFDGERYTLHWQTDTEEQAIEEINRAKEEGLKAELGYAVYALRQE